MVVSLLRSRLTDYNFNNRPSINIGNIPTKIWVTDYWPRLDLGKNSYPRISVMEVTETGEIQDIARNMEYNTRLQIDVWVWAGNDGKDSMLLTIAGTVYEGQKLLDLIAMDVKHALDDKKSDFNTSFNILHDYKLFAKVDMGQDPDRKQCIRKRIEIGFNYFRG